MSIQIKTFSIRKLFNIWKKITVYIICVLSSILVDNIFIKLYDNYYITITILFSLSMIELFSIYTNLTATGVPLPKLDLITYLVPKSKAYSKLGNSASKNIMIEKDLNLLTNKYINDVKDENKKRFLNLVFNSYRNNVINKIVSDVTGVDNEILRGKLNIFVNEAKESIRFVIGRDVNIGIHYDKIANVEFNFDKIIDKNIPIQSKKDLLIEHTVEKMYKMFKAVK